MKLSIFCLFGLKMPNHAPRIGVLGDFNINETPKRRILTRVSIVWAIKRENPSTGGFYANGWNITNFLNLFFGIQLQVRPVDGFSRLMAQTTRTRAMEVSLILLSILEVKSPPKKISNFGSVNRRFQAKLAKYWKFHIIETTATISTKFCTTIAVSYTHLTLPTTPYV